MGLQGYPVMDISKQYNTVTDTTPYDLVIG
jgi:hypothetical protein